MTELNLRRLIWGTMLAAVPAFWLGIAIGKPALAVGAMLLAAGVTLGAAALRL